MHSTRIMIITAWLICASVPAVAQDVDLPAGRIVDEGQMQVGRYTTTVAAAPETAARLTAAGARFHDWSTTGLAPEDRLAEGDGLYRLVTSFATTADEVDAFLTVLAKS